MKIARFLPLLVAVTVAVVAAPGARAAGSHDSCSGFVDSLPATIAKPGVWCLRADLATAIASGVAITVSAHHVVLDCNGHSLYAASGNTAAVGIRADNRINVTVRDCSVRRFHTGIWLDGTGHAVLDNGVHASASVGIVVDSSPGRIAGNRIGQTGKASAAGALFRGIFATGDVDIVDNTVDGVAVDHATRRVTGIHSQSGHSNVIADNRIVGIANGLAGGAAGIVVTGLSTSRTVVRDNVVAAADAGAAGPGISCASPTVATIGNELVGWTTPLTPRCVSSGDAAP